MKDPKNSAAIDERASVSEKNYGTAFDALERLSPGRGLPLKVNAYVL
jgi:hypothetical protein